MFYSKKQKGFTIVETMIVLGVTGVLFVSVSLLISGQTERYRYRDSMYRLQQQVQAQINDVQTGQFYSTIDGTEGKSNEELVGKRIIFCTKIDTGWCNNTTAEGDAPKSTQFRVNITKYDSTKPPSQKYSKYGGSQYIDLPGGINFIKPMRINSDGDPELHSDGVAFGIDTRYDNDNTNSTNLYNYKKYADGLGVDKLSDLNGGRPYLLCFEGYKKGSLELGSKELGNTVKLNLVDSRCN